MFGASDGKGLFADEESEEPAAKVETAPQRVGPIVMNSLYVCARTCVHVSCTCVCTCVLFTLYVHVRTCMCAYM